MYEITTSKKQCRETLASCSKMGDIMVVVGQAYCGHFLFHRQNDIISLSSDSLTWNLDCSLKVRILEPGESITLTVK